MSQCQVVCPSANVYNAVNIRINNPKANIPNKIKTAEGDVEFNAVTLEINNPELRQQPIYSYPKYDSIITSDIANVMPLSMPEVPVFPVAYKTSFINNRTYISTDFDNKNAKTVPVPEPYLTNVENEKGKPEQNVTFNGISFKSTKPVVFPDANLKPAVNVEQVLNNLTSSNYDVQAKQLEEIISASLKDKKMAIAYITTPVFSEMINIAQKDTSSLQGPTEEQVAIRKKIIENEISKAKQEAGGKKPEEITLPNIITDAEKATAFVLSPMEMAERNKEYSILTLSALSKIYADEFEKKTGNIVPITDLPGVSVMVDALKNSKNPSLKIAAVESLVYINRPEYNKEIKGILEAAAQDKNPAVAAIAIDALRNI